MCVNLNYKGEAPSPSWTVSRTTARYEPSFIVLFWVFFMAQLQLAVQSANPVCTRTMRVSQTLLLFGFSSGIRSLHQGSVEGGI